MYIIKAFQYISETITLNRTDSDFNQKGISELEVKSTFTNVSTNIANCFSKVLC